MNQIMKTSKAKFLVRWAVSALGLWAASELLGTDSVRIDGQFGAVLISGFILAVVNTFVRPIMVLLTLPAVLLSLGIFMIVINAAMVLLAAWLYEPLEVSGFGIAIITGILIGLVNWIVGILLEDEKK